MWEAPPAMRSVLWQDSNVTSLHLQVFIAHMEQENGSYGFLSYTFHSHIEKCSSMGLKLNRTEETFCQGTGCPPSQQCS